MSRSSLEAMPVTPQDPSREQGGRTAICFVLAAPRKETHIAAVARGLRFLLSALPVVGRGVPPRWSPARRMGFAAGLRACVHSIRRLHEKVPPILVLRPEGQSLTIADVDMVIPFDPGPYESIPCRELYFGREVFYKLEVFRLQGYERVVYLDCDTIVVGDISPLWDGMRYSERTFWAVREDAAMGVDPAVIGKFNTGVMVVNRPLFAKPVYRRLFEIARSGSSYDGGDQGVINAYLDQEGAKVAGDLDAVYNVLVRANKLGEWEMFRDRVKVLHFANNLKPWATNHCHDWLYDDEFKSLWDEAYQFVPSAEAGGAGRHTLSGPRR